MGRLSLSGVAKDTETLVSKGNFGVDFTSVAIYDNKIYHSQKDKK